MRRIVIVGVGLAGHRAAVALRREGFAGELIVIGDEPHRPYDRPPLSKQLLGGEFAADRCFFPVDGLNVTWMLGRPAIGLDLTGKSVILAGGDAVGFDGLVIATGRRARTIPALAGLDGVHTLRSLDDALAFRSATASGRPVAIIGAGFIGCEVAASLRAQGTAVTLIDVAPYPMPVLGSEAGERARRIHAAQGVDLRLGTSVATVEGDGRVEGLVLSSGERVAAEQVLVAVGSVPNSEWLVDSGLKLEAGTVVCDEYCLAAGTDFVVAAGDIASWNHPHSDGAVCIEHWTNARDMAETGAANLLTGPQDRTRFVSVPTFWSDQYNIKIKSAGYLRAADRYEVVHEDTDRPSLVVEAFRGAGLVGAIVFNRNRTALEYQRRLADGLAVRV